MEEERTITEAEIDDLVEHFYAKVRKDPELAPVFNNVVTDWGEHLALLKDFWSSVLLATGRYKGRPMMTHLPLPIEPRYFDQWLKLFAETANEVMPAALASTVTEKAERIAESLKLGLYSGAAKPSRLGAS